MKIEYFMKETGEVLPPGDLFILNGNEVWSDNYEVYESQASLVCFENFVVKRDAIGWRVVE